MKTHNTYHYYLRYLSKTYNDAPLGLLAEKYENITLDAFKCEFSQGLVFHFYCNSKELRSVKGFLKRIFGPNWQICSRLSDKAFWDSCPNVLISKTVEQMKRTKYAHKIPEHILKSNAC